MKNGHGVEVERANSQPSVYEFESYMYRNKYSIDGKAIANRLIKSTSPEKLRALHPASAKLKIEYDTQ